MNFSLKTEYALRAIYELSKALPGATVKRETIAENQHIPVHFLERILISLKKSGIIMSQKGPGGGYSLKKSLSEISMWEIYRAVDYRETAGTRCFPGLAEECHRLDACHIKHVWFSFNENLRTSMEKITLKSMLQQGSASA